MASAFEQQDSPKELADLQSLKDDLDELWSRYLDAVDRYQASMTAISKHMAEGFFSLAQANRQSTSRQRYGQDYYDQRMKAIRRYKLSADEQESPRIDIEDNTTAPSYSAERPNEPCQQPSPPATPEPEKAVNEKDADNIRVPEQDHASRPSSTEDIPSQAGQDPLRWFGILTPRELRTTQGHFAAAVGSDLAHASNNNRDVRILEVEIRKLRKSIKRAEKSLA